MSLDWMAIENSFPSFTGEETAKEQIIKLQDYMYKLTNQLKYTLQNLDTSNWNATALKIFSSETTEDVKKEAGLLAQQILQINNTINALSSRLSEFSNRLTNAENNISYLEGRMDSAEGRIQTVEEDTADNTKRIASLEETAAESETDRQHLWGDMANLQESVSKIEEGVKVDSSTMTVGKEGKPLYLVGQIYINGVLYE